MCGIAGFVAPNSTPQWRYRTLRNLLLESEIRGKDASGVAFVDPKTQKMFVLKNGVPAKEFVKSEEFRALSGQLPPVVIAHTRAATRMKGWSQGQDRPPLSGPDNNDNNHPFYSEHSGLVLVHNGLMDDDVWRKSHGKPGGILHPCVGETDSEIFLRVMETIKLTEKLPVLQCIDNTCFNIAGEYTLAILSEEFPEKLWLVRHDRTLDIVYSPTNNAVVFASTEHIIKKALTHTKYYFDFFVDVAEPKDMIINEITNNTATEIAIEDKIIPKTKFNNFNFETVDLECATRDYTWHKKAFAKNNASNNDEEIVENVVVD